MGLTGVQERLKALTRRPYLHACLRGCRVTVQMFLSPAARAPTHRRRRQGLSAPVRNLHRPGNPGPRRRGLDLEIWSLRHPTERAVHPMNRQIEAPVPYLPEYLYQEPVRVLRGGLAPCASPPIAQTACGRFWRRSQRDPTANRIRRLGQAFVMARELPGRCPPHPRALSAYPRVRRALRRPADAGRTWTFSAHAKDIWTTPDWEKREKLAEALWGVTCTAQGADHLQALASSADHVTLVYHGLDLSRFPSPPDLRPMRDGSDPADPFRIVLGRARGGEERFWRSVAGSAPLAGGSALALCPCGRRRSSEEPEGCRRGRRGFGDRVRVSRRARRSPTSSPLLRDADLFALPSKKAASGDRDGLPNVLMEAAEPETCDRGDRFRRHPGIHSPRDRRRAGAAGRMGIPFERHQSSGARTGTARCAGGLPPSSGCGGISPWRAASTCRGALSRAASSGRNDPVARVSAAPTVAFYAPLKSPDHPSPSGDRTMARLLLRALEEAGFAPEIASRLRTHDAKGDSAVQERARRDSIAEADRLIAHYRGLRGTPAPGSVVHLPCLLQGAGLDRPARRRRRSASPM